MVYEEIAILFFLPQCLHLRHNASVVGKGLIQCYKRVDDGVLGSDGGSVLLSLQYAFSHVDTSEADT